MTQKKLLQLAGIAVAFVWVFCITFAIAYTIKSKPGEQIPVNKNEEISTGVVISTTAATTMPSTASTTTVPPATLVSPSIPTSAQTGATDIIPTDISDTSAAQTTESNESKVPKKKTDIINAYVNGINTLKSTQNFSMNKDDTLNITITDIQMTGGSALKNTVMEYANSIIAPPEPESYTFIEGTDEATGETPNSTIAPLNVAAQVNPDAVTEATAQATADGGYTVSLTLQSESQSLNSAAPNLSTMVEVIDTTSLIPAGATMTDLKIDYAPTLIKATFDSEGRITSIEHKLTSKGGGSGKMIINVSMTMEGTYTSNYTINYN